MNTAFQFGFVALDIINSTVNDQGEYTCEVVSASGSAHSTAKLVVQTKREVEPDYSRSEMMRQVEMKQQFQQQTVVEAKEPPPQKPEFVKHLQDQSDMSEGANVHLEAQVIRSHYESVTLIEVKCYLILRSIRFPTTR